MRITYFIILCFSFFLTPAFAQAQPSPPPDATEVRAARTAVIPDEEEGVIRFIVDGKEVARLDADGLHVRDEVQYGGSLTDTGPADFEEKSAEADHGK